MTNAARLCGWGQCAHARECGCRAFARHTTKRGTIDGGRKTDRGCGDRDTDRRMAASGIAYLSSAPAMIIVAVFLAFPVLYAAWQSLFSISPFGSAQPFVGLGNYIDVFSQPRFWSSLGRTASSFLASLFWV
jgi:hypothetical protein